MTDVVEVGMPAAACDRVLGALRYRLAEVEAWKNGPVKDVAREAVREEMARVA
jgi:hypothetical protein